MKNIIDKLDLWIYQLISYLFLLGVWIGKDADQATFLVGAAAVFGIQVIIWRLNDLNKN